MDFDTLVKQVTDFVATSPLNKAEEIGLKRIFDQPLMGIASADDSLFEQLRNPEAIGPHHLLPGEWLEGARSVIAYFLPFSVEIRKANAESDFPAVEWMYGRIEGEALNSALRAFLVNLLRENGAQAMAPGLDSRFAVVNRRSNWSERHIAYTAGLGTFGLSKGLISKRGSAGRYGSIVTSLELATTPREYSEVYEYCTMCGECIMRCPSGAITMEGKDHQICSNYIDNVVLPKFSPRYGCGKCQTTVPCEFGQP
jgi:epoxyqueuosine reductase QueG